MQVKSLINPDQTVISIDKKNLIQTEMVKNFNKIESQPNKKISDFNEPDIDETLNDLIIGSEMKSSS